MKDYAAMSDEQIAVMVAELCAIEGVSINEDGLAVRNVVDDSPGSYSGGDYIEFDFDPCNNPADAWPILLGNKITIAAPLPQHEYWTAEKRDTDGGLLNFYVGANPLRCAMVVFLMMKESKDD